MQLLFNMKLNALVAGIVLISIVRWIALLTGLSSAGMGISWAEGH